MVEILLTLNVKCMIKQSISLYRLQRFVKIKNTNFNCFSIITGIITDYDSLLYKDCLTSGKKWFLNT